MIDDRHLLLIQAVEGIRDYAIFMLSPTGEILTWNAGAERIKGYSAKEIIGKNFSTFFTEPDLARNHPQEELEIATREGQFEEEGWRLRKNGTMFWASALITKISSPDGKLLGFSKVTRDLTERRRATESLRLSEERFRQLVEGVRDYAIFLLDTNGIVATWNEGAQRLKGYKPNEIIGQHFSRFYTPEDLAADKCAKELNVAMRVGRYEEEGWRLRKDGSRFWASVVITAIKDSQGRVTGFSKVTRDLTERRHAEEEMRALNAELDQRVQQRTTELSEAKAELENAIKSRDEFLSIASHEIKTPITSLKLQAQMLQAKVNSTTGTIPSAERLATALRTIIRQTERLTSTVDYMLDVARVQLGKFTYQFKPTRLSELVQSTLNQWGEALRSAEITVKPRIELGIEGLADDFRLEQVIANLLSNAIKYAPRSTVSVEFSREKDSAVLRVRDTGPGIEPNKIDRVFERYERAETSRGISGFGLGLFISKSIVEAHGGSIVLESQLGKGTQFTVHIPIR